MSEIFVSYRRSDSAAEARHLCESIRQALGRRAVFRDVTDIQPGAAFGEELEKRLDAAGLVLVLIGPGWSDALRERLERPEVDYVRLEVATALAMGKRIIPVLLRGAEPPKAEELPPDMAALAERQTISMRDESWSGDMVRLVEAIGRPYRWGFLAIRAAVALPALAILVYFLGPEVFTDRGSDYAFWRRLVFSLWGLYAIAELAWGYLHFRRKKRLREP